MKGKTALTLIEQSIMLLILAFAAAICLKAFVWSDTLSNQNSQRDRALIEIQSAAEVLKAHQGDLDTAAQTYGGEILSEQWILHWDADWQRNSQPAAYLLTAYPLSSQTPYLGCAQLILHQGDRVITTLQICWQEENP